jgi:ParB-like chromosome segregation protein Spo0J
MDLAEGIVMPDSGGQATSSGSGVERVPITSLHAADSPRLNGEDEEHIARLAATETKLPPILVDRRTMQVIDGMHRLRVASLQGQEMIDVKFFDGSEADTFLRAVQENIVHGLPLTHADRRAAAERVIASHPHMSDRAISNSIGLSAYTVAAIRKSSGERSSQSDTRIGTDGKIRPLNSESGRRRAAELLAEQPDASLRQVARVAGISPTTVRDVRKRLEHGESPVPEKPTTNAPTTNAADSDVVAASSPDSHGRTANGQASNDNNVDADADDVTTVAPGRFSQRRNSRLTGPQNPADVVEKLLRDPSLRDNELGKGVLRLLHINAVGVQHLPNAAAALPAHCIDTLAMLARQYAKMWQDFSHELGIRARAHMTSAAECITADDR